MTPELLRRAGEALYGPRWQSLLAQDLDVSYRTMQRWEAATRDIPAPVAGDLVELLQKRDCVIHDVIIRLIELSDSSS